MSLAYIQVQTTTENENDAVSIARELLQRKLAACVQISECSSLYRWQGDIAREKEFLCTIKTRKELFHEVDAVIQKVHPYEVPELIASPIVECSRSYSDWMDEELLPVEK